MEGKNLTITLDKQVVSEEIGHGTDLVNQTVYALGLGFPYRVFVRAREEMFVVGRAIRNQVLHDSPGACDKEVGDAIAKCVRDVLLQHAFEISKNKGRV